MVQLAFKNIVHDRLRSAMTLAGWTLYQQAQLGQLSLQTEGPPLVAEILDERDVALAKPFRVPTVAALPDE